MDTNPASRSSRTVRVLRSLALALLLALLGCVIVAARVFRHPDEPGVSEARASAIAKDTAVILAECANAAGGDWQRWQRDTEPYRDALKFRMDHVKPYDPAREPWLKDRPRVLEGCDDFPLYEVSPSASLRYLYDGQSLDSFRKDRFVVAAQRWLRRRGIALIFVVVPKMTEVYIEHFVDPCPADGIIGPHVRRTLLELLDDDVEVVDGLPLFRRARDTDSEYLYNAADTHWAPRGMRVMAREVAARIARYPFAAAARSSDPIVKAAPGRYVNQYVASFVPGGDLPNLDGWWYLTAEQRKRVEAAQTRTIPHVTLPDGSWPADDPNSPVMLVGNSFVMNFREQLIQQMNLLPRTRWAAGQTTQEFTAFLREPEALDGCRVVVWVTSEQYLTEFFPMPERIMNELEKKRGK